MDKSPLAKDHVTDSAIPCLAMRAREAARAMGVSERTLWEWTQAGDVPHVRRGKVLLYPVDELRRWLSEQAAKQERGASNDPH